MRPESEDMARLWDMLDAARAALEFIAGRRFEEFMNERMRRNAVERSLEIIGEAAKNVSHEFRDAHPEIRWRAMIALRNVLAHEYGEIRYERVWVICVERLPELVRQLEAMGVEAPPAAGSASPGP
jgi:uncharacterized protein with HEPN domain